MNTVWPNAVTDFEVFLKKEGLVCCEREVAQVFDNKFVQYENADIAVRVVCDRSFWVIQVADVPIRVNGWYDTAILRDLLIGSGEDVLLLPEQIKIIETNWSAILDRFSAAKREDTRARLERLENERMKRRLPGW
jgi:hypothetical protein